LQRSESEFHLCFVAGGLKNPEAFRRREGLLNKGCLANARLSQHHDRPAVAVPRPDQQPVQYTALALATE
jgi:hypothetical protein